MPSKTAALVLLGAVASATASDSYCGEFEATNDGYGMTSGAVTAELVQDDCLCVTVDYKTDMDLAYIHLHCDMRDSDTDEKTKANQPKFAYLASNVNERSQMSKTTSTICDLPAGVLDGLKDGKVYANLHTSDAAADPKNPGIAVAYLNPEPTFSGSFAGEKVKGEAMAKLKGRNLEVTVDWDLDKEELGYLHLHCDMSEGGEVTKANQPKFAYLTSTFGEGSDEASTYSCIDDLTDGIIQGLKDGNVYVNVHNKDGEGISKAFLKMDMDMDMDDEDDGKDDKDDGKDDKDDGKDDKDDGKDDKDGMDADEMICPVSGTFENTAPATGSSGTVTGTLTGDCLELEVDYETTSDSVAYIHLHCDMSGDGPVTSTNQPKFAYLASNTAERGEMSKTVSKICGLSQGVLDGLMAGNVYANLHTGKADEEKKFPGVAKAFLEVTPPPPSCDIEYCGGFEGDATGTVDAVFNEETGCLDVKMDYDITGDYETGYLHLHCDMSMGEAKTKANQPKFAYTASAFPNGLPTETCVCQLTDDEIKALKAGLVYVNLHEKVNGDGIANAYLKFSGDSLRGTFDDRAITMADGAVCAVIQEKKNDNCLEITSEYKITKNATETQYVHLHCDLRESDTDKKTPANQPKFAYLASNYESTESKTCSRICGVSDDVVKMLRAGKTYVNLHDMDGNGAAAAYFVGSPPNPEFGKPMGMKYTGEFDRYAEGKVKAYYKDGCLDVSIKYEMDMRTTDNIHLHCDIDADNQPKFAFLASNAGSDDGMTYSRVCDLSEEIVAQLKDGKVYVNLHAPAENGKDKAGISKAYLMFEPELYKAKFTFKDLSLDDLDADAVEDAVMAQFGSVDYEITKVKEKKGDLKVYICFSFDDSEGADAFAASSQALTLGGVTAKGVTFTFEDDESINAGMTVAPSFLAAAALALALN